MEYNSSMTGTYIFYKNGEEVARSKNIITKFGKRFLTQYLAGKGAGQPKDIAIGVGSSAASINNTQLDFEFYRIRAAIESADIQTDSSTGISSYAVVYKATLPVDVAGYIHEVGLFPSISFGDTDYQSQMISTFENPLSWLDEASLPAESATDPVPPIGANWMQVTSAAGVAKEYFYNIDLDLNGYSSSDSVTLAYRQEDLNLDYVFIRFYSSDTNYYEVRFDGSTIGDKLSKIELRYPYNNLNIDNATGYNVGTPTKDINVISVGVKANTGTTANVLFDGLRINDEDSFRTDYGMISRSVLTTPQIKQLGKEMDIEYRLGINF
jgi:archaellum component FlaF (FlaF/FlaG flagellin family)